MRINNDLPNDRESLYWLSVKSTASLDKEAKNILQLSLETEIKLIYRPENLADNAKESYSKLTFIQIGNQLQVENPTPYYISFYSLKVDGKEIDEALTIGPYEKLKFRLPLANPTKVTW